MIRECRLFELRARDLADLLTGKILAIHILNSFSTELAQCISETISIPQNNYRYADASGIMKQSNTRCLGIPLNELYASFRESIQKNAIEEYAAQGRSVRMHLREICGELPLPLDAIRAALDEIWPWGAGLLTLGELRGNPGIIRVMIPEEYGHCDEPPHIDRIPSYVHHFEGQLSAIAYINMPDKGGELELWAPSQENINNLVSSREKYRSNSGPGYLVSPRAGDVVIINTAAPHAIRTFSHGKRIVQNMFIGFLAESPLHFWA